MRPCLLLAAAIAFAQDSPPLYRCADDARVRASFAGGQATLGALGRTWQLKQSPAASGARYEMDGVVLLSKGEEFSVEQNGKQVLRGCRPMAQNPPSSKESVRGSAAYLARMALPPDAVLQVKVQDISRADAPAPVLGEVEIPISATPAQFEVRYDGTKIDPRGRYSVSARIRAGQRLLFLTDTVVPVINGFPNQVALILKPAAGKPR